ncbi:HNH endonuclease signature motif containing protein [Gluconobacter cerinus]|uniref:HNH endonuclease n=1 Tax=Gluconobacter cerinus TaxID=38307 RepID=UPI001B8CFC2D|nr:HNH endonuclease [Gluconobacter cerinus]
MKKRKKIPVWKPKKLLVQKKLKIETKQRSVNKKQYDYKWREVSKTFRKNNPFCCDCLKSGEYNSKNLHVDHIIPLVEKPELKYEVSNLQSLCRKHHSMKTFKETLAKKKPT